MARTVTHAATALALLAALPILSACMMPAPSTASTFDSLPTFGWTLPRIRAPSPESPASLSFLPLDPPRVPAPDHGFRAQGRNPLAPRRVGWVADLRLLPPGARVGLWKSLERERRP